MRILAKKEFHPAVKKKIAELKADVSRLGRDKPAGWLERKRRYEDAIAGLEEILQKGAGAGRR